MSLSCNWEGYLIYKQYQPIESIRPASMVVLTASPQMSTRTIPSSSWAMASIGHDGALAGEEYIQDEDRPGGGAYNEMGIFQPYLPKFGDWAGVKGFVLENRGGLQVWCASSRCCGA